MCKQSGESPNPLLLHCQVAREMWTMVFGLFGIQWVKSCSVLDLMSSWKGNLGKHMSFLI
jgi:hypothetical protein